MFALANLILADREPLAARFGLPLQTKFRDNSRLFYGKAKLLLYIRYYTVLP